MTTYTTRNLTAEESDALVSGLNLTLAGKTELVNAVLRVIVDQGLGIFVATADESDPNEAYAALFRNGSWE